MGLTRPTVGRRPRRRARRRLPTSTSGSERTAPVEPARWASPGVRASGAVSLAFVLDTLLAEPPHRIHPVALFGRLVAPIDRERRFPRIVGALVSACLPLAAAGVAAGAVVAADRCSASLARTRLSMPPARGRSGTLGALVAGGVLFSTTSRRMLIDTAHGVIVASETDLPRARRDLRSLAGRDSTALSPGEIRSAAVESAGENLADGLIAPLLAFSLLAPRSLPAAAGAATWTKAVNTMDSMLGYRSKSTGWAPARLDDLAMWMPARLSALLLALTAGDPMALGAASKWAGAPPSPNSGWPMATLAAIAGVRLEKSGVYALNPSAALPTTDDADRAVTLVSRAGVLASLLSVVALAFVELVGRHSRSKSQQRSASSEPRWPAWS